MQFDDFLAFDLRPEPLRVSVPALRIGMVGLGRFVRNNVLPAYRAAGYNVVAACDPDPAALDWVRTSMSSVTTYTSVEEMLANESLDVLDVNIRWDHGASEERLRIVSEAAQRGIHVQVAKPMAETIAQCEAMVLAAEHGGICLGINQNSRYAPAFFAAGELVRRDAIGAILSASISWHAARGIQRLKTFQPVWDMTVHQVDVLLSWFGTEPLSVYAHSSRRTDDGHVVTAILEFRDGASGLLHDDYASVLQPAWPMYIVGERGTLVGTDDIEIQEPGQPRMRRSHLTAGLHSLPGASVEIPLSYRYAPQAFACTMGDVLLAIEQGRQPWASGRGVLGTMRTLDAVRRSIETRQPVALKRRDSDDTTALPDAPLS